MQAIEQVQALRQAAHALIDTATNPALRGVLRALLDDVDTVEIPSPARAQGSSGNGHAAPAPTNGAHAERAAPDPAWTDLRQRVKTAQRERGIDNAQLAAALGMAVITVRKALSQVRRSPTRALAAKFEAWLADALPEPVAVPAVTESNAMFRSNGTAAGSNGIAA